MIIHFCLDSSVKKNNHNLVKLLWCSACRDYEGRICSMKNYSAAWVTGSENQRTSNVLDHATSEQHKVCTAQAKASNLPVISYAPIARTLMALDKSEQVKLRHKFDMCYFPAKHEKYNPFFELKSKHKVEKGNANEQLQLPNNLPTILLWI